jgi:hypothetical protein
MGHLHINRRSVAIALPLVLLLLLSSVLAQADEPDDATIPSDYDLTWHRIGGGGQGSGNDYAVTGVMGQPNAGESTGGDYRVHTGFLYPFAAPPPPATFSTYLPLISQ